MDDSGTELPIPPPLDSPQTSLEQKLEDTQKDVAELKDMVRQLLSLAQGQAVASMSIKGQVPQAVPKGKAQQRWQSVREFIKDSESRNPYAESFVGGTSDIIAPSVVTAPPSMQGRSRSSSVIVGQQLQTNVKLLSEISVAGGSDKISTDADDRSAADMTSRKATKYLEIILDTSSAQLYHQAKVIWAFQTQHTVSCVHDDERNVYTTTAKAGDYVVHSRKGEVYTMPKAEFLATFEPLCSHAEYASSWNNDMSHEFRRIHQVFARQMQVHFKTQHPNGVQCGLPGDYLVQGPGRPLKQFLVKREEFYKTYMRTTMHPSILKQLAGVVLGRMVTGQERPVRCDASTKSSDPASAQKKVPPIGLQWARVQSRTFHDKRMEKKLANCISDWEFDVIAFAQETFFRPLEYMARHLFKVHKLLDVLRVPDEMLTLFLREVEASYMPNPYHNSMHGADVMHSVHHFMVRTKMQKVIQPLEMIVGLVAALAHDVGHPGTTNKFQENANAPVALLHNGDSVLEHFHCLTLFGILRQDKFNVMMNLNEKQFSFVRSHVQAMILATDLKYHFQNSAEFTECKDELVLRNLDNRMMLLKTALRCADVGHAAYPLAIHCKWTLRCMQEFSDQAEKEKALGLPITVSNADYSAKGIAKSQLGFIKFAPGPMIREWAAFWGAPGKEWVDNLNANMKYWQQILDTGNGDVALDAKDQVHFAVIPPTQQSQ